MATDTERRKVARVLRELEVCDLDGEFIDCGEVEDALGLVSDDGAWYEAGGVMRLADLIEPSCKPSAEYEAWYSSLSHFNDGRGGPSTVRELIEEIVWTALTVDLGPSGNTDPSTWIDEGAAYTDKLFSEWKREALRLTGGYDRDALLALADEIEDNDVTYLVSTQYVLDSYASRIREALGVTDD